MSGEAGADGESLERTLGKLSVGDAAADVNAADRMGNTPLTMAISFNKEAIPLLLEAGADVNAADRMGNTPLHWAIRRGEKEVVLLLLEARADVNRTAYGRGYTTAYGRGYTLGDAADMKGQTPLHWAISFNKEAIPLLLEAGADVNAADRDGNTPLHWAIREGAKEVVPLLLEAGADVTLHIGMASHPCTVP